MLFLLFGSSAAGKTFVLPALRERRPELAIHDFDEIGVPAGADRRWRQRSNEAWLLRALEYQARGVDLLLAGQTPFGELLATPSAWLVRCISACLLDCDDTVRIARLRARGPEWPERPAGRVSDYLNWARWLRRHADDPAWEPEVIRHDDSPEDMCWERWSDWSAGDPRWRVRVVDTSTLSVEDMADQLSTWIEEERSLCRSGRHPLSGWATSTRNSVPPELPLA